LGRLLLEVLTAVVGTISGGGYGDCSSEDVYVLMVSARACAEKTKAMMTAATTIIIFLILTLLIL
jgi:hypothetical protein